MKFSVIVTHTDETKTIRSIDDDVVYMARLVDLISTTTEPGKKNVLMIDREEWATLKYRLSSKELIPKIFNEKSSWEPMLSFTGGKWQKNGSTPHSKRGVASWKNLSHRQWSRL